MKHYQIDRYRTNEVITLFAAFTRKLKVTMHERVTLTNYYFFV